MRRTAAVLVPLFMIWCDSAPADCGIDAARIRNNAEMACYHDYGPKSGTWTGVVQDPLTSCLSDVQQEYALAVEVCNPNPPPRDGFARVDPPKGTLAAGATLSVIFFGLM